MMMTWEFQRRGEGPHHNTGWEIQIAKRFDQISLVVGEPGVMDFDKTK
jgi:hypothetical protein